MSREFYRYFAARQSAVAAYAIEDVAIGWQIYSLRHSALDLGLVGLILFLPQLLLALPAGVLADRFDRRAICVITSLAEALGLLLFAALIIFGIHAVGLYFLAVAFVGTAHAMGIPAQRSILVNVVARDAFPKAQALSSSVAQFIQVAGPAAGGVLIAFGTRYAFAAAALAYVLASSAFALLEPHRAETEAGTGIHSALQGVRFIFSQRVILGAISLDLFAVLFGGATALLPVYATSILHVGATGFGILRAAPAIGAGIVAAYLARSGIARHAGPLLVACVAGFGVFTIVFGLSRNIVLSVIALALTGGFDMVSVVIRAALVQLGTPDALRGRVGAVENIFIGASNELGAFESGGLAALIGAPGSVVVGGVATIAVILLWLVLFPELRRVDRLAKDIPYRL